MNRINNIERLAVLSFFAIRNVPALAVIIIVETAAFFSYPSPSSLLSFVQQQQHSSPSPSSFFSFSDHSKLTALHFLLL